MEGLSTERARVCVSPGVYGVGLMDTINAGQPHISHTSDSPDVGEGQKLFPTGQTAKFSEGEVR